MNTFKDMISQNTGVSSNRFINICIMLFMIAVMVYAVFVPIDIETFKLVLEYSFYIFASSLTTKSIEKVTNIIKAKPPTTTKTPEGPDTTLL